METYALVVVNLPNGAKAATANNVVNTINKRNMMFSFDIYINKMYLSIVRFVL